MPIEGPINDLSSLNENWPLDSDQQLETDDHIRLTKDAAKKQFTDIAANGGVVTVTAAEMNALSGVTGNVQDQLNVTAGAWRFTAELVENPGAQDKLLVSPQTAGMSIVLPAAPPDGSEIQVIDTLGFAEPPDNTYTFSRSGADTITDLDNQGATNLTQLQSSRNGEYRICVYHTGVWYTWSLPGG